MQRSTNTCLLIALLVLAPIASEAAPAGGFFPRAFSYQGQLNQSGIPHNGGVELTFTLWDSEDGGSQFGNELIETVESVSGLFQVELNFGHQPWDEELWLQIEVDGQILAPRQPITAVPLASMALDVSDGRFWRQGGDSGTSTGDFLGTTDNAPFEIHVDGRRALRIEPGTDSDGPNLVSGHAINSVADGVAGATIAGGGQIRNNGLERPNTVTSGDYGTISGGVSNTASGGYATISGGLGNTASELYTTVSGGFFNNVSGSTATVGGGDNNTASNNSATVGGGYSNTASNINATISGGFTNTASGNTSTVNGGGDNTASGLLSTVPGGRDNLADGDYSFAAGRRAKAMHDGAFIWADATDADFESTSENQFLVRAGGGSIFDSSLQANEVQLTNRSAGDHPQDPDRWTLASVRQSVSDIPELHFHGPEHSAIGDPGSVFSLEAVSGQAIFGRSDKSMDLIVRGQVAAHERVRLLELDGTGSTSLCLNASNYIASCSSSRRYKHNIAPLEDVTALIGQLRPVSFRWIDSGSEEIGLVAEEVAEIEPRLATFNDDGQVEGVKYRQLSALLIRAFQEQQREIAELQEIVHQNSELEARLARLEALLPEEPWRAEAP